MAVKKVDHPCPIRLAERFTSMNLSNHRYLFSKQTTCIFSPSFRFGMVGIESEHAIKVDDGLLVIFVEDRKACSYILDLAS
jgi:hypothetical protein